MVLSEPRKKSSLQVSVTKEAAKVSSPQVEELDENHDLFRESVQGMLEWAIEEEFPEISLSENDYQELTKTVMAIRETMQGLRGMERTRENAASINQMRDQLDHAMSDFEQITGMRLTDFLLRAPAEGGIDYDESDDEEIVLEYIVDSSQ
jgi:hypothetical protein